MHRAFVPWNPRYEGSMHLVNNCTVSIELLLEKIRFYFRKFASCRILFIRLDTVTGKSLFFTFFSEFIRGPPGGELAPLPQGSHEKIRKKKFPRLLPVTVLDLIHLAAAMLKQFLRVRPY